MNKVLLVIISLFSSAECLVRVVPNASYIIYQPTILQRPWWTLGGRFASDIVVPDLTSTPIKGPGRAHLCTFDGNRIKTIAFKNACEVKNILDTSTPKPCPLYWEFNLDEVIFKDRNGWIIKKYVRQNDLIVVASKTYTIEDLKNKNIEDFPLDLSIVRMKPDCTCSLCPKVDLTKAVTFSAKC